MTRGMLGWARGHWPLMVLLALTAALDVNSAAGLPVYSRAWAAPTAVLLAGIALIASRRPVTAAVVASVVLVLWSAVLRVAGAVVLGGLGDLMFAEVLALMVIVLILFRRLPRGRAAPILAMLLLACSVANLLRLDVVLFPDDTLPAYAEGPLADLWVPGAVTVALAVAAGWHLRTRDQEQAQAISAAAAAARQRERLSLARELHDVVTHHINGIVVRADTALSAGEAEAPERALPQIEGAGIDALSAMRRMVAALRTDAPDDGAPLPATADLRAGLHALTEGDPAVRLTVDLGEPVPAEAATSVLRVVQEPVAGGRQVRAELPLRG